MPLRLDDKEGYEVQVLFDGEALMNYIIQCQDIHYNS